MFGHIGPLAHTGTNLCLPKKETAGRSDSYGVLSKMIIKCEEWEQLRLCQHIRLLNGMGLQCGNLPSVSQYRFALLPQRMAFNRLGWEMRKKVWVCQAQAPPPSPPRWFLNDVMWWGRRGKGPPRGFWWFCQQLFTKRCRQAIGSSGSSD